MFTYHRHCAAGTNCAKVRMKWRENEEMWPDKMGREREREGK